MPTHAGQLRHSAVGSRLTDLVVEWVGLIVADLSALVLSGLIVADLLVPLSLVGSWLARLIVQKDPSIPYGRTMSANL
jgi:hypothetical protein